MAGVVFFNPGSGGGETSLAELQAHFVGHRIQLITSDGFPEAVKQAASAGADFVAIAGGDGTIRGGVEPLLEGPVPLLAVPAGTRNHFAHQLGIHDLAAASRAAVGTVELVDVGEVNGQCFVNNAALGMYPKLVERRDGYQAHGVPKRVAEALAAVVELVRDHRFDVVVEGTKYRAWLVFVGNGQYGDDVFDLGSRANLNQHVLDVRILRGDQRLARLRVIAALALGRLHRSPLVVRHLRSEVKVHVDRDPVEVTLDGELEKLAPSLEFRSRSSALKVLIPAGTAHVARLQG